MCFDKNIFKSQISNDLVCSICASVLCLDSLQDNHGHNFCSNCIKTSIIKRPLCPVDKRILTNEMLKPIASELLNRLKNLEVICKYNCESKVELKYLNQHERSCKLKSKALHTKSEINNNLVQVLKSSNNELRRELEKNRDVLSEYANLIKDLRQQIDKRENKSQIEFSQQTYNPFNQLIQPTTAFSFGNNLNNNITQTGSFGSSTGGIFGSGFGQQQLTQPTYPSAFGQQPQQASCFSFGGFGTPSSIQNRNNNFMPSSQNLFGQMQLTQQQQSSGQFGCSSSGFNNFSSNPIFETQDTIYGVYTTASPWDLPSTKPSQQQQQSSVSNPINTTSKLPQYCSRYDNNQSNFGFTPSSGFNTNTVTNYGNQSQQQATEFNVSTTAKNNPSIFSSKPLTCNSCQRPLNGTVTNFQPVNGTDQAQKNGVQQTVSTLHQCITAMKEYESKSLEELKFEHYQDKRKFPQQTGLFGNTMKQTNTGGLFGSTSAWTTRTTNTPSFGNLAGNTIFSSPMQLQSTGLFGTSSAPCSGGLFGSSGTSTDNRPTSTSLFGRVSLNETVTNFKPAPETNTSGLFGSTSTLTTSTTSTKSPVSAITSQTTAQIPSFGFGFSSSTKNSSSLFGSNSEKSSKETETEANFGIPVINSSHIDSSQSTGKLDAPISTEPTPNNTLFGGFKFTNTTPVTTASLIPIITTTTSTTTTSITVDNVTKIPNSNLNFANGTTVNNRLFTNNVCVTTTSPSITDSVSSIGTFGTTPFGSPGTGLFGQQPKPTAIGFGGGFNTTTAPSTSPFSFNSIPISTTIFTTPLFGGTPSKVDTDYDI